MEHAKGSIKDFLGAKVKKVLFIPFARVLPSPADFAAKVGAAFQEMGYRLASAHELSDPRDAVMKAEAIVIGGGNTFHLLHRLYEADLLEGIRARAKDGIPYVAWSAGANIACPTIRTTNDMPVVEPPSFNALDLVPFQINPHYIDPTPTEDHIESREERIMEFIEVNPSVHVIGLREGSILRIEGSDIKLLGSQGARVFRKGKQPADYGGEDSIQFLMD